MKVTVVKEFRDLFDFAQKYEVGKVYEFEGERLKKLLALGLVKLETATGNSIDEIERTTVKRKYTKKVN